MFTSVDVYVAETFPPKQAPGHVFVTIDKNKYGKWLLGTQATVDIDQALSFHKLAHTEL